MDRTPPLKRTGNYAAQYDEIARALGSTRLQPSSAEAAFMADMLTGRHYSHGSVSTSDIMFLSAVITATGPKRGLEIGTASGVSAAVIAASIAGGFAERGEALPEVLLDTIDRKDRCLFDQNKPIGFMVEQIVPDLAGRVRIHTNSDALSAKEWVGPKQLTFAFIDGNHQHPWPLIDALSLLPLVQPGSWMVMHDIDNPADRATADIRLGARHVFQAWPGATIDGGYIGAVQVPPADKAGRQAVASFVEEMLRRPFEVSESGWKKYRRTIEELAAKATAG